MPRDFSGRQSVDHRVEGGCDLGPRLVHHGRRVAWFRGVSPPEDVVARERYPRLETATRSTWKIDLSAGYANFRPVPIALLNLYRLTAPRGVTFTVEVLGVPNPS